MRIPLSVAALIVALAVATPSTQNALPADGSKLKVILLGTMGGPSFSADRLGIGTLIVAGPEVLLFDAGRGVTTGLSRANVNPADVTKVFLTCLHSDHVISLPELLLFPWASQGRAVPLRVWGPTGTRAMMQHLQEAFSFDIHIRRDVDEKFPADGIKAVATDIREGVVYQQNNVKVIAFLVDHAPVVPAFGYRIEYQGHSVVLSGDTKPSENLVKMAQGADVLIHEFGRWKQDPLLSGPPNEVIPGTRNVTRDKIQAIANHHTDGAEAGRIFERVKPKLAVFSHYNAADVTTALRLVRETYSGPVEIGADLMTLEVGDTVTVSRSATTK